MTHLGLALGLARRELRGSLKDFRVFLACLALGVAAIAGVGSVSDAMHTGISKDARKLLGGDVSIRMTHRTMPAEAREVFDAAGRTSVAVTMRAMARPSNGDRRTLVELKAVDGAYPLIGSVQSTPALPLADALAERDGAMGTIIDPSLARRLGVSVGDKLRIGEHDFEIRAEIVKEPDRTIRCATFGPRVMISSAALDIAAEANGES